MSIWFSHMALFIYFFVILTIWSFYLFRNMVNPIICGRWSHMKLQSLPPPYPFNLQQFNQAAFVGTWALLCALSLLQSHQDFLFAYLRMRCGEKK